MTNAKEIQRRGELVEATIHEIGAAGSLDVTVGQIARRAGVSPALAFHYFGGKDRLFLAAMRSILAVYSAEVRGALRNVSDPRARLRATIGASFAPSNFRTDVVAAWLNFYVMALTEPEARRLLTVYQRRLRSNLLDALRPLAGPRAEAIAERLSGLIDGLYLRAALDGKRMDGATRMDGGTRMDGARAARHVLAALDHDLAAVSLRDAKGRTP